MARLAGALALLLALGVASDAAASLTGVCPDGSMFIVKQAADIPCARAKLVEPDEMPPVRPEFLPRPYGWQVFQEAQDPNNPYNLIDPARKIRDGGASPEEPETPIAATAPPAPSPPDVSAPPPPAPAPRAPAQLELGAEEKRDLALIVELTQQRAPASFARGGSGDAALVVRLAWSSAFEARLRGFFDARGEPLEGTAVLFTAEALDPAEFHANFTFAQGHTAFHPEPGDPRRMGLLDGAFGSLAAGQRVLGYVVLPGQVDLGQPLDVYWNDRRLVATLRP
jgi:hypothetical protein